MALRFLDSFDHYTTLAQKYNVVGSMSIQGTVKRTGPYAMLVGSGGGAKNVQLTLDNQQTWIAGFAWRRSGAPLATTFLELLDGATVQGSAYTNADGTISVKRGTTTVATSTQPLLQNVWYYIEFKHIIDPAVGTLEIRVNGAVWATFFGNTRQTANSWANIIKVGSSATTPVGYYYDDLYILDGTGGAPNNDYWGDTQVESIVPNGAGNYTEWATLVGAATHWQATNEVPPNDDTSYVEDSVADRRDTYAYGDLAPASATINGIQILMRARDTVGANNVARLYRRAADYQGVDYALTTAYAYYREILEQDPAAGPGAWTLANINASEFGLRVR